jgi:hypothetical protein
MRTSLDLFLRYMSDYHEVYLHILEECAIRLKSCCLQDFYTGIGHSPVRGTNCSVRQSLVRCHENGHTCMYDETAISQADR